MKEDTNILHGPDFIFEFPPGMTLGQLFYDQVVAHNTDIAQIQKETGEEVRFNEILDRGVKLAIYLKSIGIKVNDRLAICSENNLGWASYLSASLFIGATMCPINHAYSKREFIHTVNISKPKIIFVSPSTLKFVQNYVKELSWTPSIILLFDDPKSDVASINRLTKNIPSSSVQNFEVTNVDVHEHIVVILCSSGTTGLPKGVMLTNSNYLILLQTMLDGSVGIVLKGQVLISILPFFHGYCFSMLMMSIISGSTSVVFSEFKEEAFLETIQKYKVQVLSLVPPIMVFLAKHAIVDKYDLSSVKYIWCGAAPLARETELAVQKRLNNPVIKQAYGMTETTLSVLKAPPEGNKPGSVGKLLPGVSAKIVASDESGKSSNKALGPYCEGELCFKGGLIMKGYCGDKTATSATVDEDGWLHTGDVGYYDDEGYFFIVDRLKELIKYKGFQVPPAELESILLTHPEIKDAAVVGLPDEIAGELPLAFVVKQPNAKITAEDVVKYVNDRVSHQKRLRGGVRFIQNIPKNPSGKILRRELRNLLKSKL